MNVPLVDLQAQYASIALDVQDAVSHVLYAGNYVQGREVQAFEEEWAAYCGAKYAVGCSSGTDAIYLALRAWMGQNNVVPERFAAKSEERKVVFAPAFTFIGTIEPVVRAGLGLSLKDVSLETACVDCTEYCGDVFLPVHLYGHPAGPLPANVPIIEDAAQAHGQQLRGLMACHSFYPTKNLGAAGQGGAVVTNDEDLARRLRSLRNHGEAPKRFLHTEWSGNYRLDELQAAILRVKLPHLAAWNESRRELAQYYRTCWAQLGLDGIIPLQRAHPDHVYHILAARVPKRRRDALMRYLAEHDVQTSARYSTPMHFQPPFGDRYPAGEFPNAEQWAAEVITLPLYPELVHAQVDYVCQNVWQFAKDEGWL